MIPITPADPLSHSADLIAENVAKLRALFPELVTEGEHGHSINVDILKQLVGDQTVTDADEKYGLNWHGKRQARRLALTPSAGTLRPAKAESVDWDATQNLMIEGDNLEVLKLLKKSYAGKVKMIYIDPPYNTGKDFVYRDAFSQTLRGYQSSSGQLDEMGKMLEQNLPSSGHYHSRWLSMIYPRLIVARELLTEDGLIYISIDDNELSRLLSICDQIFGSDNAIEVYIWESTSRPDNSSALERENGQYVVCYARSKNAVDQLIGQESGSSGLPSLTKSSMKSTALTFPAETVEFGISDGFYSSGVMSSGYELLTNVEVKHGTNANPFSIKGRVIWSQSNLDQELQDGTRIIIKTDGFIPYTKKATTSYLAPNTLIPSDRAKDVLHANKQVVELMGSNVFTHPKPTNLIEYLIGNIPDKEFTVLDFFAGSGTTGDAVFRINNEDGGARSFVAVQLPEHLPTALEKATDAAKPALRNALTLLKELHKPPLLSELTKERLRRAGAKIKADNPDYQGDTGFRVFKLDESNHAIWDPNRDDLAASVNAFTDPIKPGRSDEDVLYELLLKMGLDLCVPIEERDIAGVQVSSVANGTLFVCLAREINRDVALALGKGIPDWRKELGTIGTSTAIFRDAAFTDNNAKTNLTETLKQWGIKEVRSL